MNYQYITLENCVASQVNAEEMLQMGSLERVAQNHQRMVVTNKETRLYRTQIVLSATLMALSHIWRLGK
ncbi:MAG: hypothetical protein VB009_06395 [Erysipelotrichaceae bacterium]|nr:hypothetical protein [Erysipelotrichaceae bacterium]